MTFLNLNIKSKYPTDCPLRLDNFSVISKGLFIYSGIGPTYASKMTRNGIRVVDLLDDFEEFSNKFSILADNHMAAFPGLKVKLLLVL